MKDRLQISLQLAFLFFAVGGTIASAQSTLTCSSNDGKRHYCSADTRGGVRMVNQRSGSPCQQGSTWGYDRSGVWVDRGCRADFEIGTMGNRGYGRDRNMNGNRGQVQTITCSSDDGRRHYCNADTRGGVQMVNQRSGSPCQQGSGWGYDGNGIWVDRGCRADFQVGAGGNNWNNGRRGQDFRNGGATITCSSDDGRRHYCNADTRGGVRLVNQRSGSPCQEGATWGYDRNGVWVDRGCRADFQVGR